MSRLWPGWAALLLLAATLLGGVRPAAAADIRFDQWNTREGLAQGVVSGLAFTDDGTLWVGTNGGLFTFTGSRFDEVHPPLDIQARVNRITHLTAQGDTVIMGAAHAGLWRTDGHEFTELTGGTILEGATVWDVLLPQTEGGPWWVAAHEGLFRGQLGGPWEEVVDDPISSVALTGSGAVVASGASGVWRVVGEGGTTEKLLDGFTSTLWVDPEDGIWVAHDDGLYVILSDSDRVVHLPEPGIVSSNAQTGPVGLRTGGLWLPRSSALGFVDDWKTAKEALSRGETPVMSTHRIERTARQMLVGPDGKSLWIGTDGAGIYRAVPVAFEQPETRGTSGAHMGPLAGHADHTVALRSCQWLLDYRGGELVGEELLQPYVHADYASACVRSLAVGTDDTVYVGTARVLLVRRDGVWSSHELPIKDIAITLLHFDPDGTLWIGSSQGHLWRVSDPSAPVFEPQHPPTDQSAPSELLSMLQVDSRRYVGSTAGLHVLEDGGWSTISPSDGFAPGPVRNLAVDERGRVWAATYGGGLGYVDPGGAGRLTPRNNDLPDAFLSSVTVDGDHLWVHGNRGLFRLSVDALHKQSPTDRVVAIPLDLGEANGWVQPSARVDTEDMLWLTTVDGFVRVPLDIELADTSSLAPRIDQVVAGSASIDVPDSGQVDVPAHLGRYLQLQLRAPSLSPIQVAHFRWRTFAAGAEPSEWSAVQPLSTLELSWAAPGVQVVEIQGIGGDGTIGRVNRIELNLMPRLSERAEVALGVPLALIGLFVTLGWLRARRARAQVASLQAEIDQRKAAENRLAVQERHYRQLFESAGSALLLFSVSTQRCTDANAAARASFGVPSSGAVPLTLDDIGTDPGDNARFAVGVSTCRRTDGSTFEARVAAVTLQDPSGPKVLVSVVDLTELVASRRDQERLRHQLDAARRIEALGRLAGGVAHDLNNVLTAVLGNAEFAADYDLPDSVADAVEDVRGAADQGKRLVQRLLSFNRHENSGSAACDLDDTVSNVLSVVRSALPVDVVVDSRLDAAGRVAISRVELEQVLVNLLMNAGDAMPAGGRVEVSTKIGQDDSLVLVVADDGPGIPEHLRESIFEPFYTTRTDTGGTGLGLATVQDIVERAQGTIEVDTGPAGGARFTIRLPKSQRSRTEQLLASDAHIDGTGLRVAVVDDNDLVRSSLCTALGSAGFEVIAFAHPAAAVAWFESEAEMPAALITDVVMPDLNGRELADRVHELVPGLPTLFVSGYADDILAGRGIDQSREALLLKPFTGTELLTAVSGILASAGPNR